MNVSVCLCVYILRSCLTAVGKPCQISIFEKKNKQTKNHVLRPDWNRWHEGQAPPCFTHDLSGTSSKWSADLCDINGTQP